MTTLEEFFKKTYPPQYDYKGVFRYVSFEDNRFLEEQKSAYERVLEQASKFMKREAFLWIENRKLLERAQKAEQQVKELLEGSNGRA